ncbi:MAG TPA: PLP-dependent aminotransferase family protein [Thermoanaerobaculia bacterium]|nr:PLP-dependent aminotransferase family protein [Thermoanaerobaculia bacterium]
MLDDRFSRDAANFRPSAIRAFARIINDPGIISFAGGVPNPETFPAEAIATIATKVLRDRREIALQYGPTRGLPRLCESVSALCRQRGINADVGSILMTTGSQQALDLLAHTLLDPGDVVVVELPTYIGGTASFYARSAEVVGVPQDDDGVITSALAETARRLRDEGKRLRIFYTIPNFQNPSGRLMTQQRRAEVRALAEEYHFLVIEDDPYGELLYVDADTTPMCAGSRFPPHILYLGSFSKVLAPGLRCGWIAAAGDLIEKLEIAKQAGDLCSAMLDQSIIDEFCAQGLLPPQIEKVRAFYREKRAVLLHSLEEHFSGRATWTAAEGGLFTFLTFLDDIDTASRVQDAVAAGVAYIPGAPFFVDGGGRNTMRLTFAKEGDERIREGVARLAGVFASA